jgi:hypothetical protein
MSKSKKKRDKKYRGADAKSSDNLIRVHRATAVVRSDRAQWLHDHKKLIRNIAIAILVVALITWMIISLI